MNDNTQNVNDIKPGGRTFFAAMPSSGEFVGIRDGWDGYSDTTIYDLGHCTVMNARAGNTPGEVEAALTCSIMGSWHSFTAMAMAMDTKGQEKGLALHKLMAGDLVMLTNNHDKMAQLETAGGGWMELCPGKPEEMRISQYKDGLIMLETGPGTKVVGCFSYMNGQGCGKAQGFSISTAWTDKNGQHELVNDHQEWPQVNDK